MPYDPITLLSTLSTIALPPDTQDSLSVSWLDSYRMGFPPMKHYTLCWAHTDRLPVMAVPHKCILTESMGRHNTARHISALFFFRVDFQFRAVKETETQEPAIVDFHALQCHVHNLSTDCFKRRLCGELHHLPRPPFL